MQGTLGSGSVDRDGQPFGDHVDYGTLVLEVHRHPTTDWWKSMHSQHTDSLSRRTWSVALLATASTDMVVDHLGRIDECLAALTDDEYFAVASSTSRLGVTQTGRRLEPGVWDAAAHFSPRTKLLITHFAADLSRLDPLNPLSDAALGELANAAAASWPIARAITLRLLAHPNPTLLGALAALGPNVPVDVPPGANSPGAEAVGAILNDPARYPSSWVAAAERWYSRARDESPLEQVVLKEKWIPKVPRL
jgi:hypothetical protein